LGFVTIARIVKTRAIRGEVAAELLTHCPDRFSSVRQVRIVRAGNTCWEELERYWFHRGRVILKFQGRDSPEAVAELVGGDVQIAEQERLTLPQGVYYHSDLVGCQVIEDARLLGTVTGIFETGPVGCNLEVAAEEGREFMIPMVRQFIVAIDLEKKQIEVKLPAGLTTEL
jgi:16S rRNA processing protein RimM